MDSLWGGCCGEPSCWRISRTDFQEILDEPQVKISKHLAYLRARGLVEVERSGNWMIYALPAKPSRELKANLACLQDCAHENPAFKRDVARLKKLAPKFAESIARKALAKAAVKVAAE